MVKSYIIFPAQKNYLNLIGFFFNFPLHFWELSFLKVRFKFPTRHQQILFLVGSFDVTRIGVWRIL